jgi:hypothetical protein
VVRRFLILSLVVGLVASVLGSATAINKGKAARSAGKWTKPMAELRIFAKRPPRTVKESTKTPPAVSIAMLPDGRIIYWGGLEGIETGTAPVAADGGRAIINSRVRILDLRGKHTSWSRTSPGDGGAHDMFCADQRLLPNGKLLVVGGTIWRPDPIDAAPALGPDGPVGGTTELFGSNAVRVFNPKTNEWSKGKEFMRHHRWYPTMVNTGKGEMLISSGVERLIYNYSGQNVQESEIYDINTGKVSRAPASADTSLPLFPRLHLMPDGKIFYGGVGQMWGPFGQSVDEALWAIHKSYDPKEDTWTPYGMGAYGARSGAFSILMPLKPPYEAAKILVGGGTLGSSPGSYIANDFTETITVKKDSVTSEAGPALTTPRWYSSGVLLPDGQVVAVSGADRDEVVLPGSESPVKQAEIFDGEQWTPLASAHRVRTYHNSAILLPDASVLVGGHSPINTGYGAKGDNTAEAVTGTNNLKDPSFEILKPPYLFGPKRPKITHMQKGVAWGKRFSVGTTQAGRIKKVVLMHLPSVTHITDADQRSIELPFRRAGDRLRVKAPPNSNVAPSGFYYLFALSGKDNDLTPSKARIVRVGKNAVGGSAPAPMGR